MLNRQISACTDETYQVQVNNLNLVQVELKTMPQEEGSILSDISCLWLTE